MGDSLEQWRAAIGCYRFSHSKPSTENTRIHSLKRSPKRPNTSSVESNIRTTKGLRVFPLLLVIVTLLLIIGGVQLNPGPKDTKIPFEILPSSEHLTLDHPLDSVLERHGLAIVENSGMGDCLFEALSDQLKRLTSAQVSANDLRRLLLECIQVHPILPNGEHVMTLFDSGDNKEWRQFAATFDSNEDLHTRQLSWYTNEYMVRPGVWGDNVMLYAFAKLYGIDVAIYSARTDEPYKIAADDEPGNQQRMTAKLGYVTHLHFASLVDITDVNDGEIGWRVMSDRLGDLFLQLLNSEVVEDREATVGLLSQMVDSFFEAKDKDIKWPDGLSQLVYQLVKRELERATGVVPGFLKHTDNSRHAFDEDSTEQLSDERKFKIMMLALDKPDILDNVFSLLRNIKRFLNLPPPSSNKELDDRAQFISKIVDNSIKNKHYIPDGLIEEVVKLTSHELEALSVIYRQNMKANGAAHIRDNLNEKKDASSESRKLNFTDIFLFI
ncbi:unnamed protein product [Owenia fusiformis]|uniref:OTU domain-containing protein n=1 Tax=Owenia fusiformis TaxID=6347 RepID=A0A8S4P8I5_OWEFU|nr:unnamed protein product [Owenia fusiformis]